MKNKLLSILLLLNVLTSFAQNNANLITQFINPCGSDGSNEFILGLATGTINVGNLAFASINHTSANTQPDFNWYWYGKNVINAPRPTFTPNAENCGVAGSGLSCFRLMDPGTPADATIINNVRTTLNTIAGCEVFLQVPASGDIPGGLFVVFLGAGGCGLDVPATNLNFSNHCSGGVPTQQYYLIAGNGAYTPLTGCTGGYFVNAGGNSRTSVMYNYTGGGNTNPANYQSQSAIYTNGPAPLAGNSGVIVPDGAGGSFWLNNAGCVPGPLVILDEKEFSITGIKKESHKVLLNWEMITSANYDYFVLERSFNGISFEEIKTTKAPALNGSVITGEMMDEKAVAPLLYYRIKAVALSGNTAHSTTKIINNATLKKINIFPNPSCEKFTIQSSYMGDIQIAVFNIYGIEIFRKKLSSSSLQIETAKWPAGYYSIKAADLSGKVLESHKFIKR